MADKDKKKKEAPPGDKSKRKTGRGNLPKKGEFGFRQLYSDEEKKALVTQTLIKKLETPRKSLRKIAYELGLPVETLTTMLRRTDRWNKYLEEQKVLFDTQALQAMSKGVKRINEKIGDAPLHQATISVGVLHDKVFGSSPLAQVKVGDNREIRVYYPNFRPPEETPSKSPLL